VRKALDELFGKRFGRAPRAPVPLVLYSRPGCHLCEVMKAEIARARLSRPYRLEERSIDDDEELRERWKHSIPVLEIGGRIAFKGRLDAPELERKFERLADQWTAAQEDRGREPGEARSDAEGGG
jgi:hypothetical protein